MSVVKEHENDTPSFVGECLLSVFGFGNSLPINSCQSKEEKE